MIVLDTNVLSEFIRPIPEQEVMDWFGSHARTELATTAITVQELMFGVELLGDSARGRALRAACETLFDREITRILPYTGMAARYTAVALARRREAGAPLGYADAQIAGIVMSHGVTLATRNTRDFAGLPLDVVNPWRG